MTCRTCNHPDRARIELEIATVTAFRNGSLAQVAEKFGLKKDTVYRHRREHMTQEQLARLVRGVPDGVEIDIDKLTREGGQNAVMGMARLAAELEEVAKRCDQEGAWREAIAARNAQTKILIEQAKMASAYPGAKRETVNNNLIFASEQHAFQMIDNILRRAESIPEARRMLAHYIRNGGQDVIEAEAIEHE